MVANNVCSRNRFCQDPRSSSHDEALCVEVLSLVLTSVKVAEHLMQTQNSLVSIYRFYDQVSFSAGLPIERVRKLGPALLDILDFMGAVVVHRAPTADGEVQAGYLCSPGVQLVRSVF